MSAILYGRTSGLCWRLYNLTPLLWCWPRLKLASRVETRDSCACHTCTPHTAVCMTDILGIISIANHYGNARRTSNLTYRRTSYLVPINILNTESKRRSFNQSYLTIHKRYKAWVHECRPGTQGIRQGHGFKGLTGLKLKLVIPPYLVTNSPLSESEFQASSDSQSHTFCDAPDNRAACMKDEFELRTKNTKHHLFSILDIDSISLYITRTACRIRNSPTKFEDSWPFGQFKYQYVPLS